MTQKDFLDQFIEERTASNPNFPCLVAQAEAARDRKKRSREQRNKRSS